MIWLNDDLELASMALLNMLVKPYQDHGIWFYCHSVAILSDLGMKLNTFYKTMFAQESLTPFIETVYLLIIIRHRFQTLNFYAVKNEIMLNFKEKK